jgi:hypothetical protein
MEEDPTYVPEMHELLELDIEEIQSLSKSVEKEIVENSLQMNINMK